MTPTLRRVFLLTAVIATGCASGAALREGNQIPYPDDYRQWHHVKSMIIGQGHPLHASFGGIHHVYANDLARDGLASGKYADGAVFAFDLLEVQQSGGATTEGTRKVLGVMHKSATAFADTGGWGFTGFSGASRDPAAPLPAAACFECHRQREPQGWVFSTWRD